MELSFVIKELQSIIHPVLRNAINKEYDFPRESTFIHVLERVDCNLDALDILFLNYNWKREHAIGLVARNLLTDFIVTGYVIKIASSQEEFYNNLIALYYSDISRSKGFLELFHKAKFLTGEELEAYKQKVESPDTLLGFISEEFRNNNLKKFPTNQQIIEKFLKFDSSDKWAYEINRSYNIWIFYSKYEHIGYYSYQLTRNIDFKVVLSRLSSVLRMSTILVGSCCELLKEQEALDRSLLLLEKLYKSK